MKLLFELLVFPIASIHRYLNERAPYHRILLVIYLLATVTVLLGNQIQWFGYSFYDKLITLVLMWFIYPPIALFFEHKHSAKTVPHRARKILGEDVDHLSDKELHRRLKH